MYLHLVGVHIVNFECLNLKYLGILRMSSFFLNLSICRIESRNEILMLIAYMKLW